MRGIGDMMRQAQRIKEGIDRLQKELALREVEAAAGGGMVTVRANGAMEVVSLAIDPRVIDPADREMLQDLVQAAVNEALRKSREMMQAELAKVTGGLPIPGLL